MSDVECVSPGSEGSGDAGSGVASPELSSSEERTSDEENVLDERKLTDYSSMGASAQTLVPSEEFNFAELSSELETQEWYWADASREDVNQQMANKPSGTFLIRNSSKQGHGHGEAYTLTLRSCGGNKLIR